MGAVVFTAPNGAEYGVNGLASQYLEINPIWAADPTGPAPRMNISPLIEAGLALCN